MKRKHYFILIIVIFIAGGLFLALYEMRLLYYEENKADRLTNLIFGPIFFLLLIYILISEFISTKKRWRFDRKKYLKFVGTSVVGFAVAFFVFFRPVISGLILLLNANIGFQEPIKISGRVIDKYEYSGKGAEFELTIMNKDDKVYKFDTYGTETRKYEIGDDFKMEMLTGLFGLVYMKKQHTANNV